MRGFAIGIGIFMIISLGSCGKQSSKEISPVPKAKEDGYYEAISFDACMGSGDDCLALFSGKLESDGISVIKLLPNSTVYERISLANIREIDRKTLEGAAYISGPIAVAKAREQAFKAGFTVPSVVNVDPLCTIAFSQNNSFFKPNHSYTDANGNEIGVRNVVCLGLQNYKGRTYPLSIDHFVVSHEFFHVLLHEAVIGTDKAVPEEALFYSHDLDAFNEGAADAYARLVTKGNFNAIYRDKIPWRDIDSPEKAPNQNEEFSMDIYRHGTNWRRLILDLSEKTAALPILACTVKGIGDMMRRAKSEADRIDEKAAVRDVSGSLVRAKFWEYSWNEYDVDLISTMKKCVPEERQAQFDELSARYFPSVSSSDSTPTADVSIVLFPSRSSLCRLQEELSLKPTQLRRYEWIDACSKVFSPTWGSGPFRMAETEPNSEGYKKNLMEAVYVLPSIKVHGNAADCRFRTGSAIESSELRLWDSRVTFPNDRAKSFSHMVFRDSRRGSWYRDVSFGHFLSSNSPSEYSLKWPLDSLSMDGFRFTGTPSFGGKPTDLNGYFWAITFDFASQDRNLKMRELAERAYFALQPYWVNDELERCLDPSGCSKTSNFTVECRTQMKPKTQEFPLGESRPVAIQKTDVYLFDCEKGDLSCSFHHYCPRQEDSECREF